MEETSKKITLWWNTPSNQTDLRTLGLGFVWQVALWDKGRQSWFTFYLPFKTNLSYPLKFSQFINYPFIAQKVELTFSTLLETCVVYQIRVIVTVNCHEGILFQALEIDALLPHIWNCSIFSTPMINVFSQISRTLGQHNLISFVEGDWRNNTIKSKVSYSKKGSEPGIIYYYVSMDGKWWMDISRQCTTELSFLD